MAAEARYQASHSPQSAAPFAIPRASDIGFIFLFVIPVDCVPGEGEAAGRLDIFSFSYSLPPVLAGHRRHSGKTW